MSARSTNWSQTSCRRAPWAPSPLGRPEHPLEDPLQRGLLAVRARDPLQFLQPLLGDGHGST